jgi:hypothetical protein
VPPGAIARPHRPTSDRIGPHRPGWARYGVGVICRSAFRQWITPDLPLYGDDHERGDSAP